MKKKITTRYSSLLLVSFLLFGGACRSIARDRIQETPTSSPADKTEEPQRAGQMLPITARANLKGTPINLEVAATNREQAMGLMFRPELPADRGMLFPFSPARVARFWMSNVPVALDMVFIKEGKVVAIADSVPPCKTKPQDCPLYGPDTAVDSVIELRAGRSSELGLVVGDEVTIEPIKDLQ